MIFSILGVVLGFAILYGIGYAMLTLPHWLKRKPTP